MWPNQRQSAEENQRLAPRASRLKRDEPNRPATRHEVNNRLPVFLRNDEISNGRLLMRTHGRRATTIAPAPCITNTSRFRNWLHHDHLRSEERRPLFPEHSRIRVLRAEGLDTTQNQNQLIMVCTNMINGRAVPRKPLLSKNKQALMRTHGKRATTSGGPSLVASVPSVSICGRAFCPVARP